MRPTFPASFSSVIDHVLIAADEALRTLAAAQPPSRPSPAARDPVELAEADRKLSAALMRVNHAGEICAQALYNGQALVARDARVRRLLLGAGSEERDHLGWCRARLEALGSRSSLLDPFWYAGSFAMGVASGLAGDRWSLGFLAETEMQVEQHLTEHLERLPAGDESSRAVLEQMREEERRHGAAGREMGAAELPLPVKLAMRAVSKVMTHTAYWI